MSIFFFYYYWKLDAVLNITGAQLSGGQRLVLAAETCLEQEKYW